MASSLCIFAAVIAFFTAPIFRSEAQTQNIAPSPAAEDCNGIFLSYSYTSGSRIPPTLRSDPTRQPYRFQSTLTILNNGLEELKSWRVFVGFQHDEYLVSASNAVLADGTSLPARVGNGTVFAGYPSTDLRTAVETAGDMTQMSAQIQLVGTQFGVGSPNIPMPSNISLANDGFFCPRPTMQGRNGMQVCCTLDPTSRSNITVDEEFFPPQTGDLTITYDVTRTYDTNYWAQVTISNHNPLGRLDNWKLSWDWMRDEFINAMRGAYPQAIDSSACIFGPQGEHYRGLDFSNILNCERRPTIIDLPLSRTNDTTLGMVPFCCRNGTILPPTMDPSKSISAFQINVFKMPPDLNRSLIIPPQNWRINGSLNPEYQCGPPVRVSPSKFPDPSGLPSNSVAVASWQLACNITRTNRLAPKKCCVSFSAYYNESIVPCRTCACGCPANIDRSCSATSPALLLPSQALLIPFENRTRMTVAWADLNHLPIPSPLPCGDNCGVSLNWHLFTDYRGGWTSRVTIFNWDEVAYPDWFVAVELGKASPGFQRAYSFNGTMLKGPDGQNNTVFMQGLPDMNYLVAESGEADPRVPGKQQSVISFTKRNTPGIDVPAGDGFPTRVYFNGEECSLPGLLPASGSGRLAGSAITTLVIAFVVLMMMVQL